MKLYLLLLPSALAFAITGCISIKQADIKEANFNTAGWKSNSGIKGDANIDATNDLKPNTSLSQLPQ